MEEKKKLRGAADLGWEADVTEDGGAAPDLGWGGGGPAARGGRPRDDRTGWRDLDGEGRAAARPGRGRVGAERRRRLRFGDSRGGGGAREPHGDSSGAATGRPSGGGGATEGDEGAEGWWRPDAEEERRQLREAEAEDGGGGGGGAGFPGRGSDARPLEVGRVGPVENSWIGSDIPFSWASKWRGDLARGRFPRGFAAQGKSRVPSGILGSQTSLYWTSLDFHTDLLSREKAGFPPGFWAPKLAFIGLRLMQCSKAAILF